MKYDFKPVFYGGGTEEDDFRLATIIKQLLLAHHSVVGKHQVC